MDPNRSTSTSSRRSRSRTLAEVALVTLAGGVAIAGCTFVNSFGDVKPNGQASDSGLAESGLPDTAPAPDTSPPPLDTGDSAPPPPTDTGLIVFAGHTVTSPKLVVLEAATGKELSREDLSVSGILYEGDADRDVWYVFEKGAGATDKLHVRQWDSATLKWKADLATADVPPVLDRDAVTMLSREIAYLTAKSDSPSGLGLALLSTSSLTDVAVIAGGVANFPGTKPLGPASPLGMIGTPSTVASGGFLNFPRKQACGTPTANVCELSMLNVIVPRDYADPRFNAPDVGLGIMLDSTETKVRPNFGWNSNGPEDLVAYGALSDTQARLLRLNPVSNAVSATSHFDVSGDTQRNFSLLTVAQCYGLAFVPELQSFNIHMVSVKSDKSYGSQGAGHQAQRVVFEPYTDTLLAPLETGSGASITALSLTVATDGTPTLTPRTSGWDPPKDVQPDVTVARNPSNFDCTKKH